MKATPESPPTLESALDALFGSRAHQALGVDGDNTAVAEEDLFTWDADSITVIEHFRISKTLVKLNEVCNDTTPSSQ